MIGHPARLHRRRRHPGRPDFDARFGQVRPTYLAAAAD
jgi:hypothetical protein